MKNRGNFPITAVVALAAALLLATGAVADEQTRSFPFTPGATLDLDSPMGGSLKVEGWDKNEIEITWWDRSGDTDDFDVEFKESRDGGLEVEVDWARGRSRNNNSLRFEIRAPHECDIEFRSGGGSMVLRDLKGRFNGRTAGGGVEMHGVEGKANITSGGGEIEITDSTLDGRVTTGGGKVLVENVVGDVQASSGGGNVQYKNVRDHDGDLRGPGGTLSHGMGGTGVVLISSAGGGIDLEEAPEGASVSTGGGDVSIERARKFVKATTGGGNIDVWIAGGPVNASTGAGDIEVEIGSDGWEKDGGISLSTGLGDVTLIVPEDLSMDLDLSIGYTRNSERNYRIISDVDFEEEHTDEWDSSYGTPRKYILGTGRVKGGDHKVKIRTTNGNIRLKVSER